MTPERWQQVERLYHAALECEPESRAAFLDQLRFAKEARAASALNHPNIITIHALSLCNEPSQAKQLVDELTQLYPEDTLVNSIWIPEIRATLELRAGNPARAVEQLQTATRYEAGAEFWPQHLRGQAYLELGRGEKAAAEYQKILDHRGQAALSPLYPLAHLGLARAGSQTHDVALQRRAWEEFLAAWKDADPDLPILVEAKREYEKR